MDVVKKTRKVEYKTHKVGYWSCGRDEDGHYHRTREVAERCSGIKVYEGMSPDEYQERGIAIMRAWLRGDEVKDIAESFGVTRATVTGKIKRLARLALAKSGLYKKFAEMFYRPDRKTGSRSTVYFLSHFEDSELEEALVKFDSLKSGQAGWIWYHRLIQYATNLDEGERKRIERERFKKEHPEEWAEQQREIRKREEKRWGEMVRNARGGPHYMTPEQEKRWEEIVVPKK